MRLLQALLQRAFLRAEAVFNAAFGDRLNPLYHLGAITFFLFWVVAASGLYLYAFFETGVAEAYASVERLTHDQWYAGGLLRSLHRYASDAMMVTLYIHLARHFAFDRFTGYRWFSWFTGVLLALLVYASGVNGYMLPWDRLAQYVIETTFEWLETVPGFGGLLMRNFTYASSVSDRFFSLLSFLHIGLPLAVLLLMWVHVQRVPKARTTPPRPLWVALLAALVALSLVLPVTSQGGHADFARAVSEVALDWYYLALLPILGHWSGLQVWAAVGAATLLLAALPWWPGLRRTATGAHRVTVHAAGATTQVQVRLGETLLDAGLREGLPLPYECRNGACGLCLCTVERGRMAHRPFQRSALSEAQQAAGQALLCCAMPLEEAEIEVAQDAAPLVVRTARVDAMERLAPEVMRLWLRVDGPPVRFMAGQYIHILLDDGERRAFSFANAPHDDERIELHVRRIPGGRFTNQVFDALRVGDTLRFEGPLGRFTLAEGERPILLVAAATGFAPIKSLVEDALHRGLRRPMRLYWGVRHPRDFYLPALIETWVATHPDFRVERVVSDPLPPEAWTGRRGLVHEALLADYPDLPGHEVYLCGSVRMVDAAMQALLAHGLPEDACFSDAFHPAARTA